MRVYRLCNKEEAKTILKSYNFRNVGHKCKNDFHKNTHQYVQDKNYLHFFENEISLLYLHPSKGKIVCIYNIPDEILSLSKGRGVYLDFINFEDMEEVNEYAIESEKVKFQYLETIYIIDQDIDFDYVPNREEIYNRLTTIYDFISFKSKVEKSLTGNNVAELINENMEYLLTLIPEIKYMIGFEHKHPHHHLDVWEHTVEVLRNLNTNDLELNMAALLHDIGKPFSYQDEEVRHFHGHPEISCKIAQQILTRLGYDEEFKKRVLYLIKTHDTIIDTSNLDNDLEMIQRRLQLQYADAKAHHPDKIEKRLKFLNDIKAQLHSLGDTER